ncbi:MAG: YfiR family protein [Ferruginibacter sp.]|nr:YfiR family protein [Cytophagales bacterium]
MDRIVFFTVLWLFGWSQYAPAQPRPEETENKVHTIFIYNFTKYINWPEEYNKGDFVIGVLGETDLLGELQKMAKEKSVSNRKMVIKRYHNLDEVDQRCHILFISTPSSGQLSSVLRKTKGRPTLVITQKDNLGRAGSPINFVSVNGRYKFEINLNVLEQYGLKCAQQLKTIAIMI